MKEEERDAAGCALVLIAWVLVAFLVHYAAKGGGQ